MAVTDFDPFSSETIPNPYPFYEALREEAPLYRQFYDLSTDIGETTNVQNKHPDVVKRLTALLQDYVDRGRSTPGTPQHNNGKVTITR